MSPTSRNEINAGACIVHRNYLKDPVLAKLQEQIEFNHAVEHFHQLGYLPADLIDKMYADKERGFHL
jgi:hypothetical protein